MSQNKAISVNGLNKVYKELKVLDDVTFSVEKGSIFALLGSNGAGKTTAIKIMTTLIKPDGGSAEIGGFDAVKQPEKVRREISLTGQFTAVDDILTGRENLCMIAKLRHLPEVNKKADELLEKFQLLEDGNKRAAAYSGGMRRRLDLAMSLLGNPSIIFLDEPTTGLDPQSRLAVWKIIKDLAHSGITIFLTTQYLEEADQLADKIAILNKGKIVAEGTPAELKKLLPQGHFELKFHNERYIRLACDLLKNYSAEVDEENQILSVTATGGIKQLTAILNQLETANISLAEFEQKLPTLEDVFLTIIGEKQEQEGA